MTVVKATFLGNNLPTHVRENTDIPRQKLRQLPNAKSTLKGCVLF